MTTADLHVCITCQGTEQTAEPPGAALHRVMAQRVAQGACPGVRVHAVECFGVCVRPCTVAISSPGRWGYLIADLDPGADAEALCRYLQAYAREGIASYQADSKSISHGTMARLPPLK